MNNIDKALVWFRRDLRDYDHAALFHALKTAKQVYCVFVFDKTILDKLENKQDRRVEFIWESIQPLKQAMIAHGGDLLVKHGDPLDEIPQLASALQVQAVFSNRDYEPQAIGRDAQVASTLAKTAIEFHQFKDQVMFERDEILTQGGTPYGVFTPYKNAHLKKLHLEGIAPYDETPYLSALAKVKAEPMLDFSALGFERTNLSALNIPIGMQGGKALFEDFKQRVDRYQEARNFPAVKGVSYLSVHLRFGTVSIRQLANVAFNMQGHGAATWLSELIWRDFYFQVLHHRPDLAEGRSYKAKYEDLAYTNNEAWFDAWCQGKTGYPIVDAAMRQLNQTGYMHNRLRMIVASFLVKDLLIDWRWGERYFESALIDFDFSANNGGWQWAASTGCDAQPYFRIFNPITQSEKFDAKGQFIRKYVPELSHLGDKAIHAPWKAAAKNTDDFFENDGYPAPIVDHSTQRELALALYKNKS